MDDRILMMIGRIVSFTFILTTCASESHSPLVFTNWPPTKPQSKPLRHQMMMALRPMIRQPSTDFFYKRAPPTLPQPQRLVRPMKLIANTPYLLFKNHLASTYKRPSSPISLISNHNFQSSPGGPNSGEYVFENPFTNSIFQATSKSPTFQSGSTIQLSTDRFNPIHTIPAPNLSQLEAYSIGKTQTSKIGSDYHEKEHPVFLPQRPNDIHQYQVTEETNDHTINDPFSGTRKLYAPDPDPSLPAYKINPATDPFSQPSISNTQSDIFGSSPISSPLIHSPTSSIQFANKNSQLQQNFLQQQSIVQGMPLSVYNPTYLVTQSNQLLDQHKRHLFQPASDNLDGKSNLRVETSNFNPTYSVASPGQIMAAAQDPSSEISSYELLPTNPSPLIATKYSAAYSQSNQPTLSEKEVSELVNFGHFYDNSDQNGFIASSYYDSFPDSQADFDITQQQRDNEEILRRANEDLAAKQIKITNSAQTTSIHQEHQHRLAEQFENSSLRIVVPDTVSATDTISNEVKRSDNFPFDSSTESGLYSENDGVTKSDTNIFSSDELVDSINGHTTGYTTEHNYSASSDESGDEDYLSDSKEDMAHS